MTFFVFDSNNIVVDRSETSPTATELGLLVGEITYAGMTLSVVELAIAVPADFVGGRYRINAAADGLEPNPAYVAPVVAEPTLIIQDSPLSKVEILRRITSTEWKALETSAHQDARYALAVFNAASQVDRNDPLTVRLFGALETIGILAAGRAAEILA